MRIYKQHKKLKIFFEAIKAAVNNDKEKISKINLLIKKNNINRKQDLNNIINDINKIIGRKINKDDFIRLFNNLLSNAIKYNNSNGFINISLKSFEYEDSFIEHGDTKRVEESLQLLPTQLVNLI